MGRSLTVARLGDIDVRLHPTFALVFLWVLIDWRLLGAGHGALVVIFTLILVTLIFVCVLIHELGHVYMARHFGVRVHDVSLSAIGGVARIEQLPSDPRTEVAIALAGPAANLALLALLLPIVLLVGVASGFSTLEHYASSVFEPSAAGLVMTVVYANLLILISNLVPAFPMDGGRVLRAGMSSISGRERGTRIATIVGELLGLFLLAVAIFVIQNVFVALLAMFIMVVAYGEDRAVRVESALKRMRVGQLALWDMGGISPDQPLSYALRGGPRDIVVTKDGHVVGMLWRNSLLTALGQSTSGKTVADVMEPGVAGVEADMTVYDVQKLMTDQNRWAVPVTEAGVYRGIFTSDRFLHIYRQLTPDPVSAIKDFWNKGPMAWLRA